VTCTGKELCRLLKEAGWECARVKGSHHIFKKPNVPYLITVPVHGNQSVKPGLLNRILKDAGLK
jgi:predicted RNA binding protein YcfA (HicA-like mRNA interferase family)